ncbi:MAG: ParM/StbA family protein [Ktedonobacteraceae bacterium]|nr:ParM/StbA family protein [Ktedonobacteraceae bacterium]
MKWYPYGHDFGNAEIGGVTTLANGQMLSRSIPTAFTKADTTALRGLGVDTTNSLILRMNDEEISYAIGELALEQYAEPWTGHGFIQRYASTYSLRGLLAVAASLIPDLECGLYVITGLPAETYIKNMNMRQTIKKALDGSYTFTLDGGYSWRTIHVEVALVVMEGAGALIAYGDKTTSKTAESAVIDIGGRTTDLYVARGQVPQTEYCKGKPLGVESATQILMDTFEGRFKRPLSRLEARTIMHAYASHGHLTYPDFTAYGKSIEPGHVERMVKEAITQVGTDIVSFVASTWRQSDQGAVAASFKPVLNIGGGVYYFYSLLKEHIPHLAQTADPLHANAYGYCTLAARLLTRKYQSYMTEEKNDAKGS